MPFPMKIQPIDSHALEEPARSDSVLAVSRPPVVKSRLKRLFERQFMRNSNVADKSEPHFNSKDGFNNGSSTEFEPSSVCLAKMVQNFIEESSSNEKQSSSSAVKCGRNRCNCFNGNCNDSSEDESDYFGCDSHLSSSPGDACETLKSLVPCVSVGERNLLADTASVVDKNKISKCKDDLCRTIVVDGLIALGYNASICKSRWDKSPSFPAGEYEYIDVIASGERIVIDIEFRSAFEIARSTKAYKCVLSTLPSIFVGKTDRLQKIISVVSEAAKQSLKKKGMHIPPWRKPEYVKAKWLSPYTRVTPSQDATDTKGDSGDEVLPGLNQVVLAEETVEGESESVFDLSPEGSVEEDKVLDKRDSPPKIKPNSFKIGFKTGLASVIEDDP